MKRRCTECQGIGKVTGVEFGTWECVACRGTGTEIVKLEDYGQDSAGRHFIHGQLQVDLPEGRPRSDEWTMRLRCHTCGLGYPFFMVPWPPEDRETRDHLLHVVALNIDSKLEKSYARVACNRRIVRRWIRAKHRRLKVADNRSWLSFKPDLTYGALAATVRETLPR